MPVKSNVDYQLRNKSSLPMLHNLSSRKTNIAYFLQYVQLTDS